MTHYSLADLLLALRRKINESTKEDPFKEKLTVSQLEVLWFIGLNGKKSMESISGYLKITPPSTTILIRKMEQKGLVARTKDKDDRRIVCIVLTPKTKKELAAIWKHKEAVLNKIVSKLSAKDRNNLERIIRTLIENK